MNNAISDGGSGDYNDDDPVGDNPWDNARGGGITGEDITGGGWPGYGNNLPGKGGSGKRRTGPAQNSNKNKKGKQNKNNENLSTAANVASTIKSIMVDGTALAMKAAKDLDGLPALKVTGIIAGVTSLGVTGYQALFTDHYDGKSIEKYTDLAMSGVSLLPYGWIASSAYFFMVKPLIFGDK